MLLLKALLRKTNIAKNPKYDGYQRELALIVYTFFDKYVLVGQLKMKLYLIKK